MNALGRFHAGMPDNNGRPQYMSNNVAGADAMRRIVEARGHQVLMKGESPHRNGVVSRTGLGEGVERPRFGKVVLISNHPYNDQSTGRLEAALKGVADVDRVKIIAPRSANDNYPKIEPADVSGADLVMIEEDVHAERKMPPQHSRSKSDARLRMEHKTGQVAGQKNNAEHSNAEPYEYKTDTELWMDWLRTGINPYLPTTVPMLIATNDNSAGHIRELSQGRPSGILVPPYANDNLKTALSRAQQGLTANAMARQRAQEVRAQVGSVLDGFGPEQPMVLQQMNPLIQQGALKTMQDVESRLYKVIGELPDELFALQQMKVDLAKAVYAVVPQIAVGAGGRPLNAAEKARAAMDTVHAIRRSRRQLGSALQWRENAA